jgi:hypothetical protein
MTKSTEETVMEGSGIMASCTSSNLLAGEMFLDNHSLQRYTFIVSKVT